MAVRKVSVAASVVVLLALGTLFYQLAVAPMHSVSSRAECAREYAKAKTHADTISVDFTSFPDTSGARNRCYVTRAQPGTIAGH
jgi:hypothetical protein